MIKLKQTNTHPEISIIYEDEHLLLIDKPVNMLSQKDQTGDPDVLSLCKKYLQKSKNKVPYLGLIHRLDRPVGGLMLLAKSQKAAQSLSQQMRDNMIQKTYWAVVTGDVPQNGVLTHYLLKDRDANIVKAVSPNLKKAKTAILSFSKVETVNNLQLLAIHLQTGRPHQIRVQLSAEGYPIWGDYKYGLNQPEGRRMALRAVELIFEHPVNKEEIQFELLPPKTEPWTHFHSF